MLRHINNGNWEEINRAVVFHFQDGLYGVTYSVLFEISEKSIIAGDRLYDLSPCLFLSARAILFSGMYIYRRYLCLFFADDRPGMCMAVGKS